MTYIVRKIISGRPYFYLIESKKVAGKVHKKTVAYLGKNPAIAEIRETLADLTRLESEKIIKQFKILLKKGGA